MSHATAAKAELDAALAKERALVKALAAAKADVAKKQALFREALHEAHKAESAATAKAVAEPAPEPRAEHHADRAHHALYGAETPDNDGEAEVPVREEEAWCGSYDR
jgi:multidrug resistance efflux pump